MADYSYLPPSVQTERLRVHSPLTCPLALIYKSIFSLLISLMSLRGEAQA